MSISGKIGLIQTGNLLLVGCCVCYLIWWSITFHPDRKFPAMPKILLFLITLLLGVTGIVFLLRSMGSLHAVRGAIPDGVILLIGLLLYGGLLLLTSRVLHRQVTTELLLIILWMALECCVMNSVYRAGVLEAPMAITGAVLVIAGAAVSMICYLQYYQLEKLRAYYDGMVPLILAAVIMLLELGMIALFGTL